MQLYFTKSVCPVCLRTLTAEISGDADGVYMDKTCPEHWHFHSLIWEDSAENYLRWLEYGGMRPEALPKTAEEAERVLAGADFADCACCQPASSALMTTNRCNMDCPVCFTRDKKEPIHEPDLETCGRLLRGYRARAGEDAIVELCGGEPTVREDICELASLARDIGFDFIQLNTNGVRLAQDPTLAQRLKKAGLSFVFMQFDGVDDDVYRATRGEPLLDMKCKAIENCGAANLGVTLVPTLVPGVNTQQIGEIISFAIAASPAVRGVHFQPVSYFGRYPKAPTDDMRYTIPQLIRALNEQAGISPDCFALSSCDHPMCGFHGDFIVMPDGLLSLTKGQREQKRAEQEGCCCGAPITVATQEGCCGSKPIAADGQEECCCGATDTKNVAQSECCDNTREKTQQEGCNCETPEEKTQQKGCCCDGPAEHTEESGEKKASCCCGAPLSVTMDKEEKDCCSDAVPVLQDHQGCCCGAPLPATLKETDREERPKNHLPSMEAVLKNRQFVARRWLREESSDQEVDTTSLEGFYSRLKSHGFTITAMAFQDAYTVDINRLRHCSLHIYHEGKIMPFCLRYILR